MTMLLCCDPSRKVVVHEYCSDYTLIYNRPVLLQQRPLQLSDICLQPMVSRNKWSWTMAQSLFGFRTENGIKCALYHLLSNCRTPQGDIQTSYTEKQVKRIEGHRLANFLLTYHSTPHATIKQIPSSFFIQRERRTRFSFP